jgi:hypothetical protein
MGIPNVFHTHADPELCRGKVTSTTALQFDLELSDPEIGQRRTGILWQCGG